MKKPWVKWSKKSALARRGLTLEQYQEIQKMKSEGYTRKQTSEKLQMSLDLVKKWANKPWEL
jgi:hypothetical protein